MAWFNCETQGGEPILVNFNRVTHAVASGQDSTRIYFGTEHAEVIRGSLDVIGRYVAAGPITEDDPEAFDPEDVL